MSKQRGSSLFRKAKPDSNAAEVVEVHSGYLLKSPPSSLAKNMKSWKRRFFVLAKTSDNNYELRYYKNIEGDTPIKSIEVSTIRLLYTRPEMHPTFKWIHKNFNCSPSSVLFMKAEDPKNGSREYFFIGEESNDADKWFNALFGAVKSSKSRSNYEAQTLSESRFSKPNSCHNKQVSENKKKLMDGTTQNNTGYVDMSSEDSKL